mmetsp:Transcript_21202/g.86663  ORF Transcript_21202/g.86663 Transcript_21202/m.86663 type:complete len:336 (-) Transcript_21202:1478-2485(-)
MDAIGFVGVSATGGRVRSARGEALARRRWRTAMSAENSRTNSHVVIEHHKGENEGDGPAYQLSLGERARTVVNTCSTGTLCTSSVRHDGVPFGSHVDYILDQDGRPIMLLANSAAHTANLEKHNKISLFCQPPTSSGQSGGRATLIGSVERVSRIDLEELVDFFVERHPHAKEALTYAEAFHFYRMEVEDVYFVGGFGVAATWVPIEDYTTAEADPIAFEATKLIERLNSSGSEDMRRLCTIFCGIEDTFSASVVSLDRLGLDIRVTTEENTFEYRICFRENIGTSFDAQSGLVKLLQEAWEREHGYEDEWVDAPPPQVVRYFERKRERGAELTQ